jgi:ribosomal protein L37E
MLRLIGHLLGWLIALAIVTGVGLAAIFYFYPDVVSLRDKPLATITLKEVGSIAVFVLVAVGVPKILFEFVNEMKETFRDDLDSWRQLRRRIKCPRCGELAWNDDDGVRCPFCRWDSKSQRIKCPRCGELAWSDDTGSHCYYCEWESKHPWRKIKCPGCGQVAWSDGDGGYCPYCGWGNNPWPPMEGDERG